MAKKKNVDIVITDKELTPTIIGKLDTKEKSPIILIFIFLIFIGVAIFLPDITAYIENSKKLTNTPIKNTPVKEQDKAPGDKVEEVEYFDYVDGLSMSTGSFSVSNFLKTNNVLTFEIVNQSDIVYDDDTKYFLELYSLDTTLLERIIIDSEMLNSAGTFSVQLNNDTSLNLSKVLLTKKTIDDYPQVSLNLDESNNGILTCTKNYETIKYTFGNDYLININDTVNYPYSTDATYISELQKYQMISATYNNYEGVSSTLINNETGFIFTTLIDLRNADIKPLKNNTYYEYRTLAKTVKFETEAKGYTCN